MIKFVVAVGVLAVFGFIAYAASVALYKFIAESNKKDKEETKKENQTNQNN